MTDFDWRTARNPLVQELGWCLFSEPIVDQLPPATSLPWPCTEDRGAREILATLDRNSAQLEQHLAALTDKRLGARFEAMWTRNSSCWPTTGRCKRMAGPSVHWTCCSATGTWMR